MQLLAAVLLAAQLSVSSNAACPIEMSAPQFGCTNGSATASVPELPNTTYAWSAEGAAITSGANSSRLTLALGFADAKLSCVISTPSCTTTATATIDVRDPLVVRGFELPQSIDANQPVTITWTYDNAAQPSSQLLTGSALAAPVTLDAAQRTFTFTPKGSGEKTLELLAGYATSVRAPDAPAGKRRSTSRSAATSSDCPSARVSAKTNIRDCGVREPSIATSDTAEAGSTFSASVKLESNDTAHWTVSNGTANALTGASIEVTAAEEGEVRIGVRVERGSCFAEASTTVPITAKVEQCPVLPSAYVERIDNECDTVTLRATFTGTPPFLGTWNDGTPFVALSNTTEHRFTQQGDLTIRSFTDGQRCPGNVTNAVSFHGHDAGVTLRLDDTACGASTGSLTATFTGVPPFTGCFGPMGTCEPFTTNEFEKTWTVSSPDSYRIINLRDSKCPNHWIHSNSVIVEPFHGAPSYTLEELACSTHPAFEPPLRVTFENGKPPYVVEWSDGVMSQSQTPSIWRTLPAGRPDQETMSITRAWAGGCLIDQAPQSVTIVRRSVDIGHVDTGLCTGEIGTARARGAIPPGAKLKWWIDGTAEIVGGQGTDTVQYRGTAPEFLNNSDVLYLETSFAEAACHPNPRGDSQWITFIGPPNIQSFRFSPEVIKAGALSTFTFRTHNVEELHFYLPANRADSIEPDKIQCVQGFCQGDFRDLLGTAIPAGQRSVQLTIGYTGRCSSVEKYVSAWLYID